MNSFRSSSIDSRALQPISNRSLSMPKSRSLKSNMKKNKNNQPNFWTEKILPIDDVIEETGMPDTRSIRFATSH